MGYKTNGASENVVNGNFKPSAAFINLWLPSNTESGKKKIGTIYLDDSKPDQEALIEYLKADDDNLITLINTMIVDFKLANSEQSGNTVPGFIIPTPSGS